MNSLQDEQTINIQRVLIEIKYKTQMEHINLGNASDRVVEDKPCQTVNNDKKSLYQRYSNYIDSNKCTLNYYEQKSIYPGQEKYINKIFNYIEDDSQPNKPLVFKTEPGCGIKTILVNWQKTMNQNQYKKDKILSIMHFASNGSNNRNYFYSLYRIIIKLRQSLKLKQNVDLLQENIRKFFAYWLDVCSAQVEKQLIVFCAQQIYHKIVILIESVDLFIDGETGRQANIAFWLPEIFPKNVKVIVTAARGSESLQHLQKIKCEIVHVKFNADISSRMLKSAIQQETVFDEQTQKKYKAVLQKIVQKIGPNSNTYNFIEFYKGNLLLRKSSQNIKNSALTLVREILIEKMNFKKLQKVSSITQLYNFFIDFWIDNSPLKNKLQNTLIYLSITQKGLTTKEITNLGRITQAQWNFFLIIFDWIIIKHQGVYSIKSLSFIQTVLERAKATVMNTTANTTQFLVPYHESLALTLEATQNSIRRLEQLTYHLFAAKSYFKLKQTISNIENFLLMFNDNNKYQLSKYWQKLQEKGFDLVIQYNKAVQGFSMHYHPSDQNIFRIIVQISRFLKEFCDFQTYQTPIFRHPYIQGNALELHKIGLLKELSDLDIFYDNSFNTNQDFDLNQEFIVEDQIKQLREKYFPKESLQSNENDQGIQRANTDPSASINEMIKEFEEMNKKKIKKKANQNIQILTDIEQLNVDVPLNREKFRTHYLGILQKYMKKDDAYGPGVSQSANKKKADDNNQTGTLGTDKKMPYPLANKNKNVYMDLEENTLIANFSPDKRAQYSSNKKKQDIDDKIQSVDPEEGKNVQYSFNKIRQNYRMRQIKPSLYYYKRWIWIQFPWVCISLNNNYSTTPQLSKKIQGDDQDSLQLESKYTKQALLVAIEAREKKKQMFSRKDDCMDSRAFSSKTKTNMFSISKFNGNRMGDTASSKTRLLAQKISVVPDLSLNALTKQLESRKKRLKIDEQENTQQSEIFLSEINENTQEDMKFISLRKQFHVPAMEGVEPNEVLPKLKWVIKEHTNYELSYIKSHIEEKKKKLNKIIYQNKKLSETYQELKIKEINQKKNLVNEHQSEKQHKKNKILQDLIKKKQQVITDFCKSLLQKERLKIILKLCNQNKTKNEEYLTSLNYLLQSLKKMTNFEKEHMKAITEQLEEIKILKENQNLLESQKEKNRQFVQKEAQNYLQEKQKLQKQIQNITSIIAEDIKEQKDKLESSLSGHMKNKEQKNIQMIQEKKTKLLQEKLQKLQQEYDALRQLFDFQGYDFESSEKFRRLMEENERNKKLKITYFQRKNRLEQVMAEYQKIKQENEKQAQEEMKKMSYIKESNKQKEYPQKGNDKRVQQDKCAIILNNIALKLGVKEKSEIVGVLKSKLQYLKSHNPIKYEQIMGRD